MWRALERRAALLPFAAAGVLVGVCALFSDGSSGGRLVWIGLASVVTAGALATWALLRTRPMLSREAIVAFGLLAAFVVWCGLSVLWSIEPDRSWAYLNRGLVYVALAAIGLAVGAYVPAARRLWAYVLAVVVALALGWALLGKAVPALGGSGRIARLSAPVGYWNALALLFVFGLPLALWLAARREHPHWLRAAGVVYTYALVIGILLTYSRGGVLAAGIAIAAWLLLGGPRIESAAALLLGGGAGLGVAVWAFSRPGLAQDGQAHSARVHDGAWFALVFVLGAVAVGALAYLGSLAEAERPLDDRRRRLLGRVALGVLAVGAAVAVIALVAESKPQGWFRDFTAPATNPSQTVGPGRLATVSSTSRWQWWKEAWRAFEDRPGQGSGAGSFELAHRLFRTNTIVVTEPHNVPLQFLSETGVVGFLLALGSVAAAGVGVTRVFRGLTGEERAVAAALIVGAIAFLLHSLFDFDWDFVAVCAPFFVTVGVLLGGSRTAPATRNWALATVPAAIVFAVAYSLLAPWFAGRETDSALAALQAGRPAVAARDAHRAASLDPFAIDPPLVEAGAAEQLGDFAAARALYVKAIDRQPLNWRPWYELSFFEVRLGNYRAAVAPLQRAVVLDRYGCLAPPLLKQVDVRLGRASPEPDLCPKGS
ncbi:MAG: O-antigen ligase family protein [Gaiellaceae bacterium]